MNKGLVVLLGMVGLMAQPALAQTPAGGSSASIASLLSSGYEIKAVSGLTADDQKAIWPNDTVAPYLLITLEKGGSIASCVISKASWVTMDAAALANPKYCMKT